MTNGNSAERERFEEWAFDMGYRNFTYSEEFHGYTEESIQRVWFGWKGALSVFADGGKEQVTATMGEVVYQVQTGDCWLDMTQEQYEQHSKTRPTRVLYTAPQAECAPRGAVGYAEVCDGSGGDFTMAVFNSSDVPEGAALFTAPQAECAPREKQNVMNIPLDAAATMADYAPQAECAPLPKQEPLGEPFQTVLDENRWNLYAECTPREAHPVAYLVDPGAGSAVDKFQTNKPDYLQLVDIKRRGGSVTPLYAAPTPERAQESEGVLTDGELIAISNALQGTGYAHIADKLRAILAANKEPQP
jgi:hypothetical protein